MNGFNLNNKYAIYQSVLIALLLHVFIFTLFTFTFPTDRLNRKPNLIFLGSLLQNRHFVKTEVKKKQASFRHDNQTLNNLVNKNKLHVFEFKNKKPSLRHPATSPINKINNKTLFFNNNSANDKNQHKLDKPKTDSKKSNYVPLKYHAL